MKTLDRNKTILGFSGKFLKALKKFKTRDRTLRVYLNRSRSYIGRNELESKYGLGPGETLGV